MGLKHYFFKVIVFSFLDTHAHVLIWELETFDEAWSPESEGEGKMLEGLRTHRAQ